VNHIETGLNLAARWRLQWIATDVLNFPLFQMHRCWFSMTMVSSRQLPPNRYRQWGEHLELQRSKAPAMLRPRADQLLGRVGDPQLKVAQLGSRTPHLGALHVFFGLLEAQQRTERHALSNGSTSFYPESGNVEQHGTTFQAHLKRLHHNLTMAPPRPFCQGTNSTPMARHPGHSWLDPMGMLIPNDNNYIYIFIINMNNIQ